MATAQRRAIPAKTAGILFLAIFALSILALLVGAAARVTIAVTDVLAMLPHLVYGIFLLRQRRGFQLLIPAVMLLLFSMVSSSLSALSLLALGSVLVMLALNLKGKALRLWFIPVILQGLVVLMALVRTVFQIQAISYFPGLRMSLFFIGYNFLSTVLYTVALWPMLRWVANPEADGDGPQYEGQYETPFPAETEPLDGISWADPVYSVSREASPSTAQPPRTPPAPDYSQLDEETAAALRKYKGFLDCGIITQEEFDAKRRKLLDL